MFLMYVRFVLFCVWYDTNTNYYRKGVLTFLKSNNMHVTSTSYPKLVPNDTAVFKKVRLF